VAGLDGEKPSEKSIVVGVDGSEGSKAALRWALSQAHLTGLPIDAVTVWQPPTQTGYLYGYIPTELDDESYAELAGKTLDATVADVRAEFDQPVKVRTIVRAGHPALILLEAGRNAEVLVVGSRGHGAFAGMLLGSVSQHCVQHPTCPVVVVPHLIAEHGS
jgi:nucleotide-binding universal stress UspA family protein